MLDSTSCKHSASNRTTSRATYNSRKRATYNSRRRTTLRNSARRTLTTRLRRETKVIEVIRRTFVTRGSYNRRKGSYRTSRIYNSASTSTSRNRNDYLDFYITLSRLSYSPRTSN